MPRLVIREHTAVEFEISEEDYVLLKEHPGQVDRVAERSRFIDETLLDWETDLYE